jgi:iron complex outermembrane recepter protein
MKLMNSLTFYAGYTQGFEDDGVAPGDAANRGAILPASRTWQCDAGFRYSATSTLNIITGMFVLHKSYFSFSRDNIYEVVGQQEKCGLELSVAGEVFKNFNVVAGSVWMPPKVVNTNFFSIGKLAVAQFDRLTQVAVDYRLPQWSVLSFDLSWWNYGRRVANLDNSLRVGGDSTLDLGARYRFAIGRAQATLRILFQNATNQFAWNISDDAAFTPSPPRNFQAYITIDL